MLRLACEKSELKIIQDQVGAPTGAELIADTTAHMIARYRNELSGIYHLAAAGETSWWGYANYIFELARTQGVDIKVAPASVLPIASAEFSQAARRPLNSRLNCTKLTTNFSLALPDWHTGVARTLTEIVEAHNANA
jgi:dTDP-4-dehydrorhamnose reductase